MMSASRSNFSGFGSSLSGASLSDSASKTKMEADNYGEWSAPRTSYATVKRGSPKKSGKIRSDPVAFDASRIKYPIHRPDSKRLAQEHESLKLELSDDLEQHYFTTKHSEFRKVMGRDDILAFRYKFYLPADSGDSTQANGKKKAEKSTAVKKAEKSTAVAILWDLETGFVRMSPLFKASGWVNLSTKSAPRRYLDSHKIEDSQRASPTGGHIDAQGFWIAFEDAKRLCQEFCWHIKYALTPMFGNDFPETCRIPQTKPNSLDYLDHPSLSSLQLMPGTRQRSRSDSPFVSNNVPSRSLSKDLYGREGMKSECPTQIYPASDDTQRPFTADYHVQYTQNDQEWGDEDADGESVSTLPSPPLGYSPRQVYHCAGSDYPDVQQYQQPQYQQEQSCYRPLQQLPLPIPSSRDSTPTPAVYRSAFHSSNQCGTLGAMEPEQLQAFRSRHDDEMLKKCDTEAAYTLLTMRFSK